VIRGLRHPDLARLQGALSRKRLTAVWALLGLILAAVPAQAQHAGDLGQAPPPPPGPGELEVQLVATEGETDLANLPVALYALAPDGRPGLANEQTDSRGRATFTGIANDPGIVYLVGARFAGIAFGERVIFEEGETRARVEIPISRPTTEVSGVKVEALRARVDWMGDRVVVTETLRLSSTGQRVIQLSPDASGPAILERLLPAEALEWEAGPSSIGDDLLRDGDRVRLYGPLYPGEQSVEYRFSLPVERERRQLAFPITLREDIDEVVVLAGTSGLEISGAGWTAAGEQSDGGEDLLPAWTSADRPGGQPIEVAVTLPESRRDPTALEIPRADVWIDLDDTRLNANVELTLQVSAGPPLTGSPEAPLMHVVLPRGASLEGVAPEIESMGLVAATDGFDVIGPVGAGEHRFAYSYRLPGAPDGLALDLRFPREIQTLNVLIADNGLALESGRLHRRRPFRNRTRNYLHREAYNVGMEEVVDLRIEPLRAEGLPPSTSMALTIAGAGVAALYLIAPLRQQRRREDEEENALHSLREEREAIYTAIADLEHDFETGKLEAADHAAMRERFRRQAIELMRRERAQTSGSDTSEPLVESDAPRATTGNFCPSCGQRLDPTWRFCSHCGGALSSSLASSGSETGG
jgi:hypothetical protein